MLTDIRPALRALILASPNIAAVVDTRVFPVQLPQGEVRDSIVYHRITETETYHMSGPSWLMQTRIQIDALSRSTDSAAALANLIHEWVSGFSGPIAFGSESPQEVCTVQGVFHSNLAGDGFDDATKLYSMGRDYFFWHNEVT